MKNWLEQFDRLTDGIVEGLKNIPPLFHANKRLINKLILSHEPPVQLVV